jgi:hypothetical protein
MHKYWSLDRRLPTFALKLDKGSGGCAISATFNGKQPFHTFAASASRRIGRGERLCHQVTAALTSALVAGCALMNPHLSVPPPTVSDNRYAGDLGSAINEAEELRQDYHTAVGEHSIARNAVAITLIPLTAASLAVGVSASAGDWNFRSCRPARSDGISVPRTLNAPISCP